MRSLCASAMSALIVHPSLFGRHPRTTHLISWLGPSPILAIFSTTTRGKKKGIRKKEERGRGKRHDKFLLFSWNDYIAAVTINGSQKEEESDHPCMCVHFALNGALQASDFNHLAAVCSSSLVTLCKLFGNENQPTTRKTDALMTPQKRGNKSNVSFFFLLSCKFL